MIIDAKIFVIKDNGELGLVGIDIQDIKTSKDSILAIDGGTNCTGCAIIEEGAGSIISSIAFKRDEKTKESKIRYKVELKRALYTILINNKNIQRVYYEEPYIGYADATSALFMLRTSIEELIIENEPQLDHLKYVEINNKRWKSAFLHPDKCPNGSELEKEAVRNRMIEHIPLMANVTQDEIDASSMGFVAVTKLNDGTDEDLKSKKKYRDFQYNIKFIGAESDDDMLQEFLDNIDEFKIPKRVLDNGIKIQGIDGYGKFDNKVYENMKDDDLLLIIKFRSRHHGNVILKNRVGHIAAQYGNIYALIWRKSRKAR